jgi:hypothetical protein
MFFSAINPISYIYYLIRDSAILKLIEKSENPK